MMLFQYDMKYTSLTYPVNYYRIHNNILNDMRAHPSWKQSCLASLNFFFFLIKDVKCNPLKRVAYPGYWEQVHMNKAWQVFFVFFL